MQGEQGGATTPQQQVQPQQQPRLIPEEIEKVKEHKRKQAQAAQAQAEAPSRRWGHAADYSQTQQTGENQQRDSKPQQQQSPEDHQQEGAAQQDIPGDQEQDDPQQTPELEEVCVQCGLVLAKWEGKKKKSASHKGDKINKMTNAVGERAKATTMKVKEINAEATRRRRVRSVQNLRSGDSTNLTGTRGIKWRTGSTWYPSMRRKGMAANNPRHNKGMLPLRGEIKRHPTIGNGPGTL